jgi:uncharacterized protein
LSRGVIPYRDFDKLSGNPNSIWQTWMDHPEPDAYWDAASPTREEFSQIAIPILSITGTYDDAQLGTIRFWERHLEAAGARKTERNFLVLGPWDHAGSQDPQATLGGLRFGKNSVLDLKLLHLRWYDWILKNGTKPAFLKDHFIYNIVGANVWVAARDIESATQSSQILYLASPNRFADSLRSKGNLDETVPSRDRDHYVYDPSLPGHDEGPERGERVAPDFLTSDALMKRLHGDGLIYDTRPFGTAKNLVGRPQVHLAMTMDVPDTDIRVQFYEIRPSGSAIFLAQDQMRARYRVDERHPVLVTPGTTETYEFDKFPFISRTIPKGSRIRLVICPLGASIHNQRNRNSGGVVADETEKDNHVAHVHVELGPGFSYLKLPFGENSPGNVVAPLR